MEIKIRNVQEEDLQKLAEIYAEVYDKFDVGEKWTKAAAYEISKYWLKRSPDLCFLAEEDERTVGAFFVGVKPWWDGNHLVDGEIFVHPECQMKGIGTKLLKFVLKYALEKYDAVRWDTYTFRDKYPARWYKSIGFEEIDEWTMISGDVKKILSKLNGEK